MGFVVEHNVLKPDPQKVDMISKARAPENVQELQSFLGLTQFYKNMLPHLAHVAHPLYAATSENFDFQWTEKLEVAFQTIKWMLIKEIMQTNLEGEEDIEAFVMPVKMLFVLSCCNGKGLYSVLLKFLMCHKETGQLLNENCLQSREDIKNCFVLCMACTSKFILIINHWSAFSKKLGKFQTTVCR